MKLGLCILGCGEFAGTFAQEMAPLGDEIDLYFASRDAAKAADYNRRFHGSGSFGSYQEAAADPSVEALYLCTPHYLHREHVALSALAGKHVLVEKPIARTVAEAAEIIKEAQQAGVNLMVAENYRFMAVVRQAKELIEDGAIGDRRLGQLQEEALFQPTGWRNSRDLTGGGVFIDGGIHKVDILTFLAGRPQTVYATAPRRADPNLEAEDGLVLVTTSETGVVGVINHSSAKIQDPAPKWVSVLGTEGRLYFELSQSWLRLDDGRAERTLPCPGDRHGLATMVREFRDSIRQGREPEMSGREGMEDLEIVVKAYQSMESGVAVTLG